MKAGSLLYRLPAFFCILLVGRSTNELCTKESMISQKNTMQQQLYSTWTFCAALFLFLIIPFLSIAQQSAPAKNNPPSVKPDTTTAPLLQRKEPFTPQQIITGDTTRRQQPDTSSATGTTTPGEYPYSPEQDKFYYEALQLKIPPAARFQYDLQQFSPAWQALMELRQKDPNASAAANMNLPASVYQPLARDRVAYDYGIAQALTIPGIYDPFARSGGVGKGFALAGVYSFIGKLFGLIEDVSPTISYSVEQPSEVEITIYSIQALAISHVFKGLQQPGSYTLTWNLRNDKGQIVSRGDYIAETRIGNGAVMRKRIKVDF